MNMESKHESDRINYSQLSPSIRVGTFFISSVPIRVSREIDLIHSSEYK
jgi:hypothetical protein